MLFAAVGFFIGGVDDCIVDLLWIFRQVTLRLSSRPARREPDVSEVSMSQSTGPVAIFVPAWDEAAVIGAMLSAALGRYDGHDYCLYVGCYRNDLATTAQVAAIGHHRLRMVICDVDGPTTKADCLNRLWCAAQADALGSDRPYQAVVLHDAEDLVSRDELPLFTRYLPQAGLVQLPVVPLIDPDSRWISGHYCDEFAEAHGKTLLVREFVGAAIPSAGVGCAIAWDVLARLAQKRDGRPFDVDSLTEDYELGLRIHAAGDRTMFVRRAVDGAGEGGAAAALIATRAHFPATLEAAVRQKTRWIIGIALAGWDRLGWSGSWAECWMRLRDRRAVMSALVLASAYCAALLALLLTLIGWLTDYGYTFSGANAQPLRLSSAVSSWLLGVNLALLLWRLAMRAAFVASVYGWREGLRAIPRAVVANIVTILAVRRAVIHYARLCKGQALVWDKTSHKFPPLGFGR